MKHTFPLGHKFGGNKKKPYRTKQVGVRVPVDLYSEIVGMVKDRVEQWKVINGLKQNNSFDKLKELKGIDSEMLKEC